MHCHLEASTEREDDTVQVHQHIYEHNIKSPFAAPHESDCFRHVYVVLLC